MIINLEQLCTDHLLIIVAVPGCLRSFPSVYFLTLRAVFEIGLVDTCPCQVSAAATLAKCAYTAQGLLQLVANQQIVALPESAHGEPEPEWTFVGREQEGERLLDLEILKTPLKALDKQHVPLIDYATMSGAGKSRWGFAAARFLAAKKSSMDVRRIGLNFNGGTGAGSAEKDFIRRALEQGMDDFPKSLAGLLSACSAPAQHHMI
eukprot:6279509-Amphidinium_carterae.1